MYHHYVGSSETELEFLKQGLEFEPCGWRKKNIIGRGDPTKGGRPGIPAEISHR